MCTDFDIFVYRKIIFMRTNIDIDDNLMEKALKFSGNKTKKEIINTALSEYVKYRMRQKMLSLYGKVAWVGNLDKMRRNG
jgi:Arc/MetJ family transcription regulator